MQILNGQFPSIEQVASQYLDSKAKSGNSVQENGNSFAKIFEQKQLLENSPLKFSKHASARLNERNINLTGSQLDRLNAGTQAAGEKGIQESLVLMDQLAFIVNVKNQTVITAMDQKDASQNVFTNIDGAVIV